MTVGIVGLGLIGGSFAKAYHKAGLTVLAADIDRSILDFARLVPPMALAATACGADGLIIEVHNDPIHALCDGAQSLTPEEYDKLAKKVDAVRGAVQ